MHAENHMPFQEMVVTRTKQWIEEYDQSNRARIGEAITLTMRKRGDYFGRFYNRSTISSQWRPFTGKGMVTYPIIERTIRSKTATAVATKVQTEIEAVRNVPEKQAAADLARNIIRYCRESHWTKQLEANIAEFGQLHRFSFIYNNYQTEGGAIVEVPETKKTETKTGDTLYNCSNCGFQYTPEDLQIPDIADEFKGSDLKQGEAVVEPKMLATGDQPPEQEAVDTEYADGEYEPDDEGQKILEHTANLPCPECQTNTLVLESRAKHETVDSLTGNYQAKDCGYLDVRVVSPLQIRIDSYKCLGFDYKRADWFNYHPLVPAYELLSMAPQMEEKISTGSGRWSEAARWHFELNHNTSTNEGYAHRGKAYHLDDLVEINVWWIAPQACVGWKSPDTYELPEFKENEDGEFVQTGAVFTINPDETVEQAYMRTFKSFKGMLLIMWEEEIIGIGNEYSTEKWVGVPWKIDSQSFFPQGEENLLQLQDAATNVLSLIYSHVRRRAAASLVADPLGGFSEDAVQNAGQPGNIIYREAVSAEVADTDWRKSLGYLEPGSLDASIQQFVQLIIEIAKETSGVFNETVGNVETSDETLGGREIALTQSLSLMTPTQQAKALGLREAEYVWLELWQSHAPEEAYSLIKGTFEEEWKPQDIAAFKALNIRRELFITIVDGTDTPRTQSELEQRFMAGVNMGLFREPNPLPINIRSHIVKSVLGIDFDLGNYSAYKRLAARRYEVIKQEVEILTPNEAFTVIADPMTQFPVRVLRPEIVASIAQDVRTAPRGTDEHLVFIEYFTDQINGLAGAKEPNEVLIFTLEKQIDTHRAFLAANTVQGMTVQGIADNAGGAVSGAANPPPADPSVAAPAA